MALKTHFCRVPITINPTYILLVLILARPTSFDGDEWIRVLIVACALTISLIWHEVGHVLLLRKFGIRPEISLSITGSVTQWEGDETLNHFQRVAIGLSGPFFGLILGVFVWFLIQTLPLSMSAELSRFLTTLYWINGVWTLLNLMPIFPLDGAYCLRAILDASLRRYSNSIFQISSGIMALFVIIYSAYAGWFLLTIIGVWSGILSLQQWRDEVAENQDKPLKQDFDWLERSFRKEASTEAAKAPKATADAQNEP